MLSDDHLTHLLDARIGLHHALVGQSVPLELFVVREPGARGELPKNQTKSVDIGPPKGIELFHVDRVFEHLGRQIPFGAHPIVHRYVELVVDESVGRESRLQSSNNRVTIELQSFVYQVSVD